MDRLRNRESLGHSFSAKNIASNHKLASLRQCDCEAITQKLNIQVIPSIPAEHRTALSSEHLPGLTYHVAHLSGRFTEIVELVCMTEDMEDAGRFIEDFSILRKDGRELW